VVKALSPEDRRFSQVAILDLAYFANFGAEVAAVSILPTFFDLRIDCGASRGSCWNLWSHERNCPPGAA